ncbi:hypothetical protein NZK32_16925 [Cyanobium sp. FGCU-52]|nr:hypothetical protein [Cyanobium sp. FGCU52]
MGIVPESAQLVSERLEDLLRHLVQDTLLIDHVRARLGFSSGVVDLADVNWNIGQAILQADTAARQAKEHGRSRVQMVGPAQLTAVQQ